jgi:hypothetical protein
MDDLNFRGVLWVWRDVRGSGWKWLRYAVLGLPPYRYTA